MIDTETLMNDKKLLREELEEEKAKNEALHLLNQALMDELGDTYQKVYDLREQVYDLTAEVHRLTEIVEKRKEEDAWTPPPGLSESELRGFYGIY